MSWSVVEAPADIARVVTRLIPTRSGAIAVPVSGNATLSFIVCWTASSSDGAGVGAIP
ncbi:MAG: hypothetical protein NT154_21735 [Verrucomicrobia bacterium]|nr:hypothetical protein [Verrucomicrobiota bacterium]